MGGTPLLGVAASYLSDGQDHPQEDFKQPSAGGWGWSFCVSCLT